MVHEISVALVGAGSMGGALLKGWLANKTIIAARSAVFDPGAGDAMKMLCAEHELPLNPSIDSVTPDVLVLAVKPQIAPAVLPEYSKLARDAICLSVMAGKSIASISSLLGNANRVCRVMPNLPAAIGKGVSGLFAPNTIEPHGRKQIEALISAAGETVWVERENHIDFVTAISGSGPAYFFLLTEALAEVGASLGLDQSASRKLALATFTGAGALMEAETRTIEEMRKAVMSPGGTTEAALRVFDGDEHHMRTLVQEAVAAAATRAGQLTD